MRSAPGADWRDSAVQDSGLKVDTLGRSGETTTGSADSAGMAPDHQEPTRIGMRQLGDPWRTADRPVAQIEWPRTTRLRRLPGTPGVSVVPRNKPGYSTLVRHGSPSAR